MQDEVNEKTISLCVRGVKMSAALLKAARGLFGTGAPYIGNPFHIAKQ